jgi:hypothetical protein
MDPAKVASALAAGINTGYRMLPLYDSPLYEGSDGTLNPGRAKSMTSTDGVNSVLSLRANLRFTVKQPATIRL